MRAKTEVVIKKVLDALTAEPEPQRAKVLAKKCRCSVITIYRAIRIARIEKNIGIHPTKSGYLLSEFAKKTDDVHFLRVLNGRRSSDYIALQTAAPHMRKRWNTVEDQRTLQIVMSPLTSGGDMLKRGIKILLSYRNYQNT
jgi:hypothetical protein